VTLSLSGPATITPQPDGSVTILGHGVGAGTLLLPDGSVTLAWTAGQASLSPTGGANVLLHGTLKLDICAALA
jgi:hypothetical protein